ncbi:Ras family guanine nucleotide exchange factor BUD5 [Cyberlindnera jadinii NRRL Y-1542]|uniref:Ras GEF n=1 Tax=Cyberlindnera jadinii (strain ATCC 18201 / CBS 1600 / BCRC 20928 / JCM 3617 / NBRC 0987 / NRRL Y-1542) TaxID=983966 RepID=A0A1E4S8Z7_CYBJN|nr:ras GEF [Cyberlindnera jadinii NRRL Y-1542]ODV75872.1 ras GEF [Cyberlindnera jadinii NRRL Y-1542]
MPLSKSRIPLKLLLISTAKFLNNPIDNPLNGDSYFSLDQVNAIRDGVRYLLELTNCLSRSTLIVRKRPIIRRMRKTLLADWYSLMIKADSYKHTHNLKHVETLQLMALQVVKKSITFLDIWSIESESLKKEEVITRRKTDMPLLRTPPFGKARLNEIHNVLFGYIGLLLGRLDMVEHNPAGCQLLENITHQMILLLKELLYINKSCVNILDSQSRRLEKFDDNLDVLLSLVSELVSSVKNFVTKMINESNTEKPLKQGPYQYSSEGLELMGVISRMTRSISLSVDTCYKYLAMIGDFKLSEDKEYTDFSKVQITADQFIKTCSLGMIKTMDKSKLDMVRTAERNGIKRQSKFSMVRSGNDNFTVSGSNLLQEFLPDSKSFMRSSVFQPYLNETGERYEIPFDRDTEILYDSEGSLIGASFRGLVYLLTDELRKTQPFFISTFFLTFKSYSTSDALIEELISRFNFEDSSEDESTGDYYSYDSRLKNRRRLIAKIFQLWIQSYWDYTGDYNLIPTLINFFNEEVSQYLPIESKKLIELCSKLIIVTPSLLETTKTVPKTKFGGVDSAVIQLVSRRLSSTRSAMSNSSSVNSFVSLNKELDDEEHIFEEYELTKVKSSSRNSTLLPLPGLNFNHNSLLNKSQISEIEHDVIKHRIALSSINWPVESVSRYIPMETQHLLKVWYDCCQSKLQCEFRPESHLAELNGFELAKQLTIIESRIFLSVKPEELLNQNFLKRHHLSPNIQQSLLFTNLLSAYVLESILEEGLIMKKRTIRIKQWLNIALSCYYLKNFNSLAAIVISLQSHILSRLDEVWASLPEKYQSLFSDLKKIIHPTNNYKGYRYKLSKILKDGDTKSPIPVVPYVNLFLQDLTFINEGNRDYRNSESFLKERIINFDKFRRVAKIIANMEYLQVGYDDAPKKRRSSVFSFGSTISLDDNLTVIPPLQEYILLELLRVQQLNLRDDERAWKLSKKLKP